MRDSSSVSLMCFPWALICLAKVSGVHLVCHMRSFSPVPNETAIKTKTQRPILPPPQGVPRALTFPGNRDGIICFHSSKAPKLLVCHYNSEGCKPQCDCRLCARLKTFIGFSLFLRQQIDSNTRQIKNDCCYSWFHQSTL